ncbi:hypothetical protein M514_14228 [Trichuris suis]|uniref:Uncharacterized protein n=1 Tax=Trichuris suis TaxID=68888 RepID=A0A085LIU9_9BILA|nr:hypothetical protein M513_14228 [Trichuris suis]KFD59368.1 hypothetical protein M514_14228 [Trichuris suis]
MNRTIWDTLAKGIITEERDWDMVLPKVMMACRATPGRCTKCRAGSPKKPPGKSGIMIVVRIHGSSELATLSSCLYRASCKDETKSSESHVSAHT